MPKTTRVNYKYGSGLSENQKLTLQKTELINKISCLFYTQ